MELSTLRYLRTQDAEFHNGRMAAISHHRLMRQRRPTQRKDGKQAMLARTFCVSFRLRVLKLPRRRSAAGQKPALTRLTKSLLDHIEQRKVAGPNLGFCPAGSLNRSLSPHRFR